MWELSSFSEAAMAAVLLALMLALAGARQLPQGLSGFAGSVFSNAGALQRTRYASWHKIMWELSSPGEAAMAAVWLAWMLAEPPLSQPR